MPSDDLFNWKAEKEKEIALKSQERADKGKPTRESQNGGCVGHCACAAHPPVPGLAFAGDVNSIAKFYMT